MALETTFPQSRRALLAAAAGALAAFAAQAIGRPLPAGAADGATVKVGGEYTGTTVTKITNSTNTNTVIWGASTSGYGTGVRGTTSLGNGVYGSSTSGDGVKGESSSRIGVLGLSSSGFGVRGSSASNLGVYGSSTSDIGVQGYSFASDKPGIRGQSGAQNTGVYGSSGTGPPSPANTGVYGYAAQDSTARGVTGASVDGTGVQGSSGSDPVPLPPAKTGVYGYAAQDATARGVLGRSVAGRGVAGHVTSGDGLFGVATSGRGVVGSATTGIAGHFASTDGTALQVNGRARFSTSGRLAVAAGASEVTITLASVTTASMVLALLQSDEADVWVRAAVPVAGSFTVHFNTALATNAILGYFVIN